MKIKVCFLLGDLSSVQVSCQEESLWYCISTTQSTFSSCCQKIKSFYYFTKIIITMTTNPWPREYHKITWQKKATTGNKEWTILEAFLLWKCSFFWKLGSGNPQVYLTTKERWSAFINIYRDTPSIDRDFTPDHLALQECTQTSERAPLIMLEQGGKPHTQISHQRKLTLRLLWFAAQNKGPIRMDRMAVKMFPSSTVGKALLQVMSPELTKINISGMLWVLKLKG